MQDCSTNKSTEQRCRRYNSTKRVIRALYNVNCDTNNKKHLVDEAQNNMQQYIDSFVSSNLELFNGQFYILFLLNLSAICICNFIFFFLVAIILAILCYNLTNFYLSFLFLTFFVLIFVY
jgi:hypothetical protein